jgi:DHA2 family multidrug resistance protein
MVASFAIWMWLSTPMMNESGWEEMLLSFVFRGIALPFSVATCHSVTLGEIPPERLKLGSRPFTLMRNLGGAFGIAACATILNNRSNFHFLHIAEHLNFMNRTLAGWMHRVNGHYNRTAALKQFWDLS